MQKRNLGEKPTPLGVGVVTFLKNNAVQDVPQSLCTSLLRIQSPEKG
ncbi:MAG: hypothetical protein [Siphoviridae sp. ctpQM7]|nr:MAG: hypothetical protein [Siphoviridae sp. ctpQM7]